ncbi:helix-turn-helix domain-containing protein [Streptomyces odontomachi]|uniref:helix-turn-helix domain-containing protein n=1 Tax=Streptomyces odontomachi TaxID=2944940 RepID=UPI00210A1F07|nr:helix-turn-helix domain-containing protein [Streptomyces sp. ODS25]
MNDVWGTKADEVSVRQLLELPALAGARLIAGRSGAGRTVTGVRIAPRDRVAPTSEPGTVLVIDGARLATDTYCVDFALRSAEESGAAMLLVPRPATEIGLASRRLSDKLGIALVTVDGELAILCDQLREQIHAPTRHLAGLLMDLIDRLGHLSPKQGAESVLHALDAVLDSRSSLIGFEGGALAGVELDPPLPDGDRLPVQTTRSVGDAVRIAQPIALVPGEQPTFWIVTERTAPTAMWLRVAGTGLRLAGSYLATRLISERLERERDARFRLGILNAIIALSESPSTGLVQQIGTLGWKVDGWCTALHIQVAGEPDQQRLLALTDELQHRLAQLGLGAHIVERPNGWTTWTTSDVEPPATSYRQTTQSVGAVLRAFVAGRTGMRVYAGIGRPYAGIGGLKKSLAEAQEATTIVQAGGTRTAVQHIDEMGMQRILFGWYASQEFATFATTLLRPLLAVDRDEELLRTLETYLDNESSPTVTADVLGVHRNTVVNRVARIRHQLSVDLDDPDQRLAVQLACRVVNLET